MVSTVILLWLKWSSQDSLLLISVQEWLRWVMLLLAPDKKRFPHKYFSYYSKTIFLTPLTPLLYCKLGFLGVYIFLISAQKHRLQGRSNEYPQPMFWTEIWKIAEFLFENFQFFGGEIFNIFEKVCFRNAKVVLLLHCLFICCLFVCLFLMKCFFSSPEHKVLKVSYCDQPLSGIQCPSCIVHHLSSTISLNNIS